MPSLWQSLANTMAKVCQYDGKKLPIWWQKIANMVAKDWLFHQRVICVPDYKYIYLQYFRQ
ncbi:hypothetical protein DXB65_16250 [Bacteroides oleiciplenus]|uniref:Uncharacterized protein n=1 Tax=Bacteroides oleiciplenus TaxID=626931 RepID=A0A3E5B6S2_9BACE|nr:hypothetical protein DXB65_16250 [Bacteroides oleiciplenus]